MSCTMDTTVRTTTPHLIYKFSTQSFLFLPSYLPSSFSPGPLRFPFPSQETKQNTIQSNEALHAYPPPLNLLLLAQPKKVV